MANLTETNDWTPAIYQLERTDPMTGGAEGIANLQAKQLANRTQHLKETLAALTRDAPEGLDTVTKLATALADNPNAGAELADALARVASLEAAHFQTHTQHTTQIDFNDITAPGLHKIENDEAHLNAPPGQEAREGILQVITAHEGEIWQIFMPNDGSLHIRYRNEPTDWRVWWSHLRSFTTHKHYTSAVDFDTLTSPGLYKIENHGADNPNAPPGYAQLEGLLEVFTAHENEIHQRFTANMYYADEATVFVRLHNDRRNLNQAWRPWVALITHRADTADLRHGLVPTGIIAPYALEKPPDGWLACHGGTVSRTTFARLFAAIGTTWGAGDGTTTFQLPDFRGEFLRGWDHGRGLDPGRSWGKSQADSMKKHRHEFKDDKGEPYYALNDTNLGSSRGSDAVKSQGPNEDGEQDAGINHTTYIGGTETRPRNIAITFCIKY